MLVRRPVLSNKGCCPTVDRDLYHDSTGILHQQRQWFPVISGSLTASLALQDTVKNVRTSCEPSLMYGCLRLKDWMRKAIPPLIHILQGVLISRMSHEICFSPLHPCGLHTYCI